MTKSRANSAASRLGKAEPRVCSRIPAFSFRLVTFRPETSTPSMPCPMRWRAWSTRSLRSASDSSSPDRRKRLPCSWTFTSPKIGCGSETSPASTVAHQASIREALVFARGLPVTGAVPPRCVVRFMYQAQRRNRDRYRRLGDPRKTESPALAGQAPLIQDNALHPKDYLCGSIFGCTRYSTSLGRLTQNGGCGGPRGFLDGGGLWHRRSDRRRHQRGSHLRRQTACCDAHPRALWPLFLWRDRHHQLRCGASVAKPGVRTRREYAP